MDLKNKVTLYGVVVKKDNKYVLMLRGFLDDKEIITDITNEIIKNDKCNVNIEIKFNHKLNAYSRLLNFKLINPPEKNKRG